MFGLGNILGSFGTIPDILMGKKPKDALLDNLKAAAVVGTGMAFAPGLLGAGAAGSAPGALFNAAADSQLANAAMGADALGGYGGAVSTPTLVNGSSPGLLDTVSSYAKPVGQAAQAANAIGGLLGPQKQPMQVSPVMQNSGGSQSLASLANMNEQAQLAQLQSDMQRRARRQQLIGVA